MRLKRSTPQNIVIGGAAGAFPPMIGWAAATRRDRLRIGAAVPDHLLLDAAAFLGAGAVAGAGLCARRHSDAAGRRGLPLKRGAQILVYALVLAPVGASPWLFGYAGLHLWRDLGDCRGVVIVALSVSIMLAGDGPAEPACRQAAVRLVDRLSVRAVCGAVARRPARRTRSRLAVRSARGLRDDQWIPKTAKTASCSPRSRSGAAAPARSLSRLRSDALVLLFYVVTIVKLGPDVLRRPL